MSLFQKIRDGQVTKPACVSQLAKYEAEKVELVRTAASFGPELYAKKLGELNLSIDMLKIVIDKFEDISGKTA